MAAGFEVEPDDLDTFATNLQVVVDKVGESKTAIDNIQLHPLVFGIVGQFFAIGVHVKIKEARDAIGKYEAALGAAKDNTKLTAQGYRDTDRSIAESLKV